MMDHYGSKLPANSELILGLEEIQVSEIAERASSSRNLVGRSHLTSQDSVLSHQDTVDG